LKTECHILVLIVELLSCKDTSYYHRPGINLSGMSSRGGLQPAVVI
jgi:hypothetical protein